MKLRLLACLMLGAVLALQGRPALANGRFPKAQMILTPPGGDGRDLVLRTTFGILFSHDGGAHFQWLCESALGFTGTWDPPLTYGRDGRVVVGLESGLRTTRGGCNVQVVAELVGEQVSDLTLMPDGVRVAVATSTARQLAAFWVEKSGGGFERRGSAPAGLSFETIEVAPADEKRVYATGIDYASKPLARLLRSDDGGATFREMSPKLPRDGHIFVSHVDPKNRDRLVLRQITSAGSSVLVSTDGGASFRETLARQSGLYGFAAAEDGRTLYAASGAAEEGLARSEDGGETWTSVVKEGFLCLHARRGMLYACSNPFVRGGYALGRSRDRGASMQHLASFADIQGPVACAKGPTKGPSCAAEWNKTLTNLGTEEPPEEPEVAPDAGSAGADAGADSGHAPDAAATDATPRAPRRTGCGCYAAQYAAAQQAHVAAWLGALALLGVRRRRRAASCPRVDPTLSIESDRLN